MPASEALKVRSVLILKPDRLYAEVLRQYTLRVFPKARVRIVASLAAAEVSLAQEQAALLITGAGASLEGDVLDALKGWLNSPRRVDRVLVVAAHCEYRLVTALEAIGADGVFDSVNEAPEQLMEALRVVGGGARYWSTTLRDDASSKGTPASLLFRVITGFEQVVLSVIGDGCDDTSAARELGLSPATVATVRRELHRKLGVQHRGELVRFAAQHGFVRFTSRGVVRPGFALLSASYYARKARRGSTMPIRLGARVASPPSLDHSTGLAVTAA